MSRKILADYCRLGWHLVQIPLGHKGPTTSGWNKREMCIADPEVAEWLDGNIGLAHAYSGTCAIDIDNVAAATAWLAERKVNLTDLLNAQDAVRIESRPGRAKLIYKLGTPLPSFKIAHAKKALLEFRCASEAGLTVQDVLPPSIHPDTGQPYTWRGDFTKLPPLPPGIATIWASMARPVQVPRSTVPKKTLPEAAKLREVLTLWDPDCEYDDWIKVGMALHHECDGREYGLAVWNEWSATGKKYKGLGDLEAHWRSFKRDHANPRTLASLRIETTATTDDFADVGKKPAAQPSVPSIAKRQVAAETIRGLTRNKLGKIEARISNLTKVLGIAEISGYELAFDVFLDAIVVMDTDAQEWKPLDDNHYTALRVWLETVGNCEPISHEMMRHGVQLVASQQTTDSAQLWLDKLEWDGIERIERFCPDYFGTEDTEYAARVGAYIWTALAGRVRQPGCQADMVPVLIGRQGVGKSRGVQAMSPAPDHFAELRIDDSDDNIARKMRGCLVAELAEMRGMRAADIERIKAFITRTHEHWVPKYKEFSTTYPRRFIMIGTTNDEEFLPIDTEHRRWLPLHTRGVDVAAITAHRDQLWAEGAVRFAADGIAWKKLDILAQPARENAMNEDIWTNTVEEWCRAQNTEFVRLEDVLTHAIGMDPRMVNRQAELRASRVLRALGYVKTSRRIGGKVSKVWVLDPLA
jgi:hypothetical protein